MGQMTMTVELSNGTIFVYKPPEKTGGDEIHKLLSDVDTAHILMRSWLIGALPPNERPIENRGVQIGNHNVQHNATF